MAQTSRSRWTYYKYTTLTGLARLLREDEQHHQESFHRRELCWKASNALFLRQASFEIDSQDIISEQEAESLIQSISSLPKK